MPIQLPATGGTAQGKTDSGSSLTVSFTLKAGVERLLVVSVAGAQVGGANITGATWNGSAMTLAGSYTSIDSNNRKHYAFYLLLGDSLTDTTANIVVSGSGADYIGLAAAQYNGVLQTGQPDISVSVSQSANAAGSHTTTLTTATDHAWVVICESGYNDTGDPEASTGTVFRVAETTYGTCGILDSGGGVSPAGSASFTTARNATAYRISHIAISFKPGALAPPLRLYVDGVEQYDGDQGDGAAFRAAVEAKANIGGSVTVELGSATDLQISQNVTTWRLPANSAATPITIGVHNVDAVHAAGTPLPVSKLADVLTIKATGSSSDPYIDAEPVASAYIWDGVAFDYSGRAGNCAICAGPKEILSNNSTEQDAWSVAQMPDGWTMRRFIFKTMNFGTTSFQFFRWDGKALTQEDYTIEPMKGTGQDGYYTTGVVGVGPIIQRRFDIGNVRGETFGWGSHGWRGGGTPGVGNPGFQGLAAALHQPLELGHRVGPGRVTRDLTKRRACWTSSTFTIGTGSKTLTVPPNMPFVNGEPILLNEGSGNNCTGTVTSYSGTSLVVNITAVAGSGTINGAIVARTDEQISYKTWAEWTYGQDITVTGMHFQYHWLDYNSQNYGLNTKLSTMDLAALTHVALRRITFRYCVFQSLSGLWSILRDTALAANPAQIEFVLQDCLVFDVDELKWGAPSFNSLIFLGLDMPANVKVINTAIDCVNTPGQMLLQFGSAGLGHDSIAQYTGHEWVSNLLLQQGTEAYEMRGYYGTGPTLASNPKEYLDNACVSPVLTHNSIVTSNPTTMWNSAARHASNTFYTGGAGRTSLLGLLRDPANSTLADRDYRYIEGQEQYGANGLTRGPDWAGMYLAMGEFWPFSWEPDLPETSSIRQPNPVHLVRRFWPRQPARRR